MLSVFVKEQNRPDHTVGLRLDQLNKSGQHFRQWGAGCDFFQYEALTGNKVVHVVVYQTKLPGEKGMLRSGSTEDNCAFLARTIRNFTVVVSLKRSGHLPPPRLGWNS